MENEIGRFRGFCGNIGRGLMLGALMVGCVPGSSAKTAADAVKEPSVGETVDSSISDANIQPSVHNESGQPDAMVPQDADAAEPRRATAASDATMQPSDTASVETRVVRFEWCPIKGFHGSYSLSDEADQHRIVFPKGMKKGKSYPVVIAFHGQPKRGKDPRNYSFMDPVQQQVVEMVERGDIEPVILVMPVFRFLGTNWPQFNPGAFQKKVEELLAVEGVSASEWYAFGHSGAAGCGGEGLNQIHRISPKGVGFFDTCLGEAWQKEVGQLQKAGIETFNIHSVETAGFKPKTRPEYQADFDFGRAYSPLGIEPVSCPTPHPGEKLRPLPYRCSATGDGVIHGFVIDTGEGAEAHSAILEPAISFFLKHFLSTDAHR